MSALRSLEKRHSPLRFAAQVASSQYRNPPWTLYVSCTIPVDKTGMKRRHTLCKLLDNDDVSVPPASPEDIELLGNRLAEWTTQWRP